MNQKQIDYTFAGGPTMAPDILKQSMIHGLFEQEVSLLNLNSSHKQCEEVKDKIRHNIRNLLNVPNNFHIWFCAGGAHLQFAGIPMNFFNQNAQNKVANYTTTGWFSKLAFSEAQKYCNPHEIVKMTKDEKGQFILPQHYDYAPNALYTHFVDNQTVQGLEYPEHRLPYQEGTPLIDDCSSSMLTKPIDWSKVSLAYGHAQKNFGISGCVVMIARDEFLETTPYSKIPSVLDFRVYKQKGDFPFLTNSSTIYSIFKMTEDLIGKGGVNFQRFRTRSDKIYDVLDKYPIYLPKVKKGFRSRINVTWDSLTPELGQKCIKQGIKNGLHQFKGHRTMGGFRASLFNLVPDEGVAKLRDFLQEFGQKNS